MFDDADPTGNTPDEGRQTVREALEEQDEPRDEEPKPLGQEAPEIIDDASKIGSRRLHRPLSESAITGFIGGMSVSFGAVAMAWAGAAVGGDISSVSIGHLVGALAFPVGFVILLVGKSELFTEDFFLPVTAILERRGRVTELAQLWGVTLLFNLIGALVFGFLISRAGVFEPEAAQQIIDLSVKKVDYDFSTAFVKALFAGWLMTLLTWLLVAAEGFGSKLVLIWIMGSLIVLGQFNHVVISASEIFMGMFLDAPVSVTDWVFGNFTPALLGNLVGGIIFVTLLFYVQARTQVEAD